MLNFFNYWDDYLSFSIFSGKTSSFYIEDRNDKLKELHKYRVDKQVSQNSTKVISLNEWSMDILNVPFYPEKRVFLDLIKNFKKNRDNQDLNFIEIQYDNTILYH